MKRNIICLLGIALTGSLFTSCSDDFLKDKKNYDNFTPEVIDNYKGAVLRINAVYGECLPNPNAAAGWNNNQTGYKDDQSQATEEYYGFGCFLNPLPGNELSAMNGTIVPDYFQYQQNYQVNVWGRIRGINEAIQAFQASALSQEHKDELIGQCLFFRAWCYYQLVKWYGGVPIIKEVQETSAVSYTPRSSAKACFDFIISDLDEAANLLKAKTGNGGWDDSNWGRVTTGTALALKGRVLTLWCSPMFNRSMDQNRYSSAYTTMKADLANIQACGYGLYPASGNNGEGFAKMFNQRKSQEAVFVTLTNSFAGDGNDVFNNSWENLIRPYNTSGRTSAYEPSRMIIDLFPMRDGKISAHANNYTKIVPSTSTYETDYPFMNRDPRFYRTFAFPGVKWYFKGQSQQGYIGEEYALWNYVWYANASDEGDVENGKRYGADGLMDNVRGIYIRKRSDDLQANTTPLYSYDTKANNGAFTYNGNPYMEIRYAEVLLNLAEVACGAGQVSDALGYLNEVRARVELPALTTADFQNSTDENNKDCCMSAILYERMVEFAYEGKRFDDMRRWMLFDGGLNQGSLSSTWALSGVLSSGTCSYLGIEPMNGKRRERIEFRSARPGYGTAATDDPIKKAEEAGITSAARCEPLDYTKSLFDVVAPATKSQQETLKDWYKNNLKIVQKKGDEYQNKMPIYAKFYPKYYFLGLPLGAMNRNDSRLQQTIGWEGKSGMGTFDPLAE